VNDEVPEARRVGFRIGLHVGEAMVRSGDLFGDAVNIAAGCRAWPRRIGVLSGAAYEYVRTALPLDFEDIGAQRVKNLEVPDPRPTVRAASCPSDGAARLEILPPSHRRVQGAARGRRATRSATPR